MKINYKEYLQSPQWRFKRSFLIEKFKTCQLCNSPENLHAHHRTYERLGHELPEDLTLLCKKCHEKFHQAEHDNIIIELERLDNELMFEKNMRIRFDLCDRRDFLSQRLYEIRK